MTTIRRQLTRKLLLAFAVPVVVAGAVTFVLIRDELVEQFDAALFARATAIAAATKQTGDEVSVELPAALAQEFQGEHEAGARRDANGVKPDRDEEHEDEDAAMFQIRRRDGTSLLRSPSLGAADLPRVETSDDEGEFRNVALPTGPTGRSVTVMFRPRAAVPAAAGADLPRVVLTVAVDRRDLDRTIRTMAMLLSGAGILVLAATFILVPRVVRHEFAPLDRLADDAARIEATSLGTRFATANLPGELSAVTARLNDLLSRLEASFDRERQFSDALAHELRTPVAELRSVAEVALKWPDSRPADTDRDVLAVATHMESLITSLLAVLRSEDGRQVLSREPVAVHEALLDIWSQISAAATARQLEVFWALPADVKVSSDPVLLRSIATNLMRNAVEYAPAGTTIEIRAQRDAERLRIWFSNDTEGLTAEDLERVFDRFWRRDASRTGEHAGLGLALARSFARALGGDVTAALHGTRVTFTLTAETAS